MSDSRLSGFFRNIGKTFKGDGGRFENGGYDPEKQYPCIRSSICTGEKVAGFKDINGGHFTEIMLIRSPKDIEEFKKTYHVDELKVEY